MFYFNFLQNYIIIRFCASKLLRIIIDLNRINKYEYYVYSLNIVVVYYYGHTKPTFVPKCCMNERYGTVRGTVK